MKTTKSTKKAAGKKSRTAKKVVKRKAAKKKMKTPAKKKASKKKSTKRATTKKRSAKKKTKKKSAKRKAGKKAPKKKTAKKKATKRKTRSGTSRSTTKKPTSAPIAITKKHGIRKRVGKKLSKIKNDMIERFNRKYHIKKTEYLPTGVPGFDPLLDKGIPQGSAILVSGGAGSGKTIFCLQTLMYHASRGKKCFYMSFEESEEKLIGHMLEFGWDPREAISNGTLIIQRFSPFDVTRSVEAMLAKEKGELLIDFEPVILPEGFKPEIIALDSLNAVASAFIGNESTYRIYIEQLFRFFEQLGSTSFLISETRQMPEVYSHQGIEEFLADGVFVFYHYKRGHLRKNAVEILKLRGANHKRKIVFMKISDKGVTVYPHKEVLEGVHWTAKWGKK